MDELQIAQFEKAILKELIKVSGKKLGAEDILEWNRATIEEAEEQQVYFLPELKVFVAVDTSEKKGRKIATLNDFLGGAAEEKPEAVKTPAPPKTSIPHAAVTPKKVEQAISLSEVTDDAAKNLEILKELIEVTSDPTFNLTHILAWSFMTIGIGAIGEKSIHLPKLNIYVLVKK